MTPWGFVALTTSRRSTCRRCHLRLPTPRVLPLLPPTGALGDAVRAARSPADLAALANLIEAPAIPVAVLDQTRTPDWQAHSSAVRAEVAAFVAAAHPGLDVASPEALELPLADLHAQAQAAAASSWFGRKKRLRAVLEKLTPGLRPDASVDPKRVPEVTGALVQLQGAVHSLAARAAGVPGLAVPYAWNPLTAGGRALVDRQVEWLQWAGSTIGAPTVDGPRVSFPQALRGYLAAPAAVDASTTQAIKDLADAFRRVAELCRASTADMALWSGDDGLVTAWQQTAVGRDAGDAELRSLQRWVALRHHLLPLSAHGMAEAHDQVLTRRVAAEDALKAFERGLAEASIQERGAAPGSTPSTLRPTSATSPVSVDRPQRSVTTDELPARSGDPRAALPERHHDGPSRCAQPRARQAAGRTRCARSLCDVRRPDHPAACRACWSARTRWPGSSRPRSGIFDLVVFDEASQIRVADAVGAMGRADRWSSSATASRCRRRRSPSRVGGRRGRGGGASSEVVQDEESILTECVQARVRGTGCRGTTAARTSR